jgi:murein L,D-transpeptidase YcbB/YkuD
MRYKSKSISLILPFIAFLFLSCNYSSDKMRSKEIVENPIGMNEYVLQNIKSALVIASDNNGIIEDSLQLKFYKVVEDFYYQRDYAPVWSDTQHFNLIADQLLSYLDTSINDGLFKNDYHYSSLLKWKKILTEDSLQKKDAVAWSKAELLFTDAFMNIICDLKQGRLLNDSTSWKNDTSKFNSFFHVNFKKYISEKTTATVLNAIQPHIIAYSELKKTILPFIENMDTVHYTLLNYPTEFKSEEDSFSFINNLQLRFKESGYLKMKDTAILDSSALASVILKYQLKNKLKADGKLSSSLIRNLNATDQIKLKRIFLTLDKYKQLPDSMPLKYIWVNLPAYTLNVYDNDTVRMTSKIICGKPTTQTPILSSEISEIIIFPTWTVPASIIKKEMLPGLKKNPYYLSKKGLSLYDNKGDLIDPLTVNWTKYSKGIPYQIKQGSGEKNALGVIKFNFQNPFDVYLHDTNQRYFFSNTMRALSHGCVRVQDWQGLANFIVKNDSMNLSAEDKLTYNSDSISNWISRKEKHKIAVKFRIPLFIRYISCEGGSGKVKFYDDIYDDDKRLIETYFVGK